MANFRSRWCYIFNSYSYLTSLGTLCASFFRLVKFLLCAKDPFSGCWEKRQRSIGHNPYTRMKTCSSSGHNQLNKSALKSGYRYFLKWWLKSGTCKNGFTLGRSQVESAVLFLKMICVLPVVRVPGRERRLLETMQLAIGEFITDSSQGLLPSPRVWGRKAPSPSFLRYLLGTIISWHKWIGYTVGSWCKRIGYTVARQFFVGLSAFPW